MIAKSMTGAANVSIGFASKGTSPLDFYNAGGAGWQVRVNGPVNADRALLLGGSFGSNPTIDVTAGSLAITPATLFAGAVSVAGNLNTRITTVGALGSAGTKGAKAFVTDANATFTAGIGAVVAAGGANNVPVTADGTNWRIG